MYYIKISNQEKPSRYHVTTEDSYKKAQRVPPISRYAREGQARKGGVGGNLSPAGKALKLLSIW